MSDLIIGKSYDPGRRDYNEDRVDVRTFRSANNVEMTVGVIADGVGGEKRGEAAAQRSVDTVFDVMMHSPQEDIPTLLEMAATEANRRVYTINQRLEQSASTLAIAAIVNKTLYVANIGDSRVYLCRNKKLTQLTLDHSFANLMPLMGKLSPEAAAANPRADNIMRAIGSKETVPVDLGFYVNTQNMQVANQRGRQGLPLKDGDSIIVCSDGLIKPGDDGLPFCRDEEIIDTVGRLEGDKAAKTMVSYALGRDTDDNVSVAVIQMPNKAREKRAAAERRRPVIYGVTGALGLIALASLIGFFLINRSQNELNQARQAQESELAAMQETQEAELVILQDAQDAQERMQATSVAEFSATSVAFEATSDAAGKEREESVVQTVEAMAALNEAVCTRKTEYRFDVGEVTFSPDIGTTHTRGELFAEEIEARWTVSNEGCPATNVRLMTDSGRRRVPTFINADGEGQGSVIFEGEEALMVIKLDSIAEANRIDEALTFLVDDPDGESLELDHIRPIAFSLPNNETWIALITPEPSPTRIVVVESEVEPTAEQFAVVESAREERPTAIPTVRPTNTSRPRPTATRTPNWNATVTVRVQQTRANQTETAAAANVTRTVQARQADNERTREAFNQSATATLAAQQTRARSEQNARNVSATQTREAQVRTAGIQSTQTRQAQAQQSTQSARSASVTQTAVAQQQAATRNAQVTQSARNATATANAQNVELTRNAQSAGSTRNAQNAQATQTAQAQINAGNAQATESARSAQATQTKQAEINAAQVTQTRQAQVESVNATLTAAAQSTATNPPPANTAVPAPTDTSLPPTATPLPATSIPATSIPSTPVPNVNAPTLVNPAECVLAVDGFIQSRIPFQWTGDLTDGQSFGIRVASQGQNVTETGTFIKGGITQEGRNGNRWSLSNFSMGVPIGEYAWTVALIDNGVPRYATQVGCLVNGQGSRGGGDSGGNNNPGVSPQTTPVPTSVPINPKQTIDANG